MRREQQQQQQQPLLVPGPILQSVRERQQLNIVAFPRSVLFAEVSEDHGSVLCVLSKATRFTVSVPIPPTVRANDRMDSCFNRQAGSWHLLLRADGQSGMARRSMATCTQEGSVHVAPGRIVVRCRATWKSCSAQWTAMKRMRFVLVSTRADLLPPPRAHAISLSCPVPPSRRFQCGLITFSWLTAFFGVCGWSTTCSIASVVVRLIGFTSYYKWEGFSVWCHLLPTCRKWWLFLRVCWWRRVHATCAAAARVVAVHHVVRART